MSQTDVARADSLTEQDPHNIKDDKKQKDRRPASKSDPILLIQPPGRGVLY